MKTTFFLCCMAVVVGVILSDNYGIDKNFFDQIGLSTICQGNLTFSDYSLCEKRCDQMNPPEDCPDVTYVGCACKDEKEEYKMNIISQV
ncbi:TIL domain-containing protein [Nephila pilipes]|uniref:TIL domain-containing protein n=1 Tax=Nephila pilipes TaxID=299642 RepID=A0A8X6NSP5_NEPPI|nr:TIL domain-containing protein [Nephila pilipes]